MKKPGAEIRPGDCCSRADAEHGISVIHAPETVKMLRAEAVNIAPGWP